jgi:hypothetical protein
VRIPPRAIDVLPEMGLSQPNVANCSTDIKRNCACEAGPGGCTKDDMCGPATEFKLRTAYLLRAVRERIDMFVGCHWQFHRSKRQGMSLRNWLLAGALTPSISADRFSNFQVIHQLTYDNCGNSITTPTTTTDLP